MEDLFKKNKNKVNTLQAAIYDTLKEIILNEKIIEGFTENEIAKKLSVSRTPVREAMKQLSSEGLIEIFHGRKAKINYIEKSDIADISIILKHLHIVSSELCVKNITEEEILELKDIIDFIHFFTEKKNYAKLAEYNTEFHLKICEFSKNKWLYNIMKNLLEVTFPQRKKAISKSTRIIDARDEHTQIFLAIKEKNVEKLNILLESHVTNAYKRFERKEVFYEL